MGPPDPTGEFVAGPVNGTIAAMHVEVKEGSANDSASGATAQCAAASKARRSGLSRNADGA